MDDKYITDEVIENLSDEGKEFVLKHYGVKRRSGRYPWGSGEQGLQRARTETESFSKARKYYKSQGLSDESIRNELGMTTTEWRDMVTRTKSEETQRMYKEVKSRIERGESRKDLAAEYGVSLSTIDNYANMEASTVNARRSSKQIADVLSDKVDQVNYLDVSAGVEIQLGVSKERLRSSIKELTGENGEYKVEKIFIPQVTNPSKYTTMNVLVKKDVEKRELMENIDKIRPVDFYFDTGNAHSLQNLQVPKSIDFDRVGIRYAIPEGKPGHGSPKDGATMDGAMFIRPGVKDLDLGNSKYAQVRIAVGDTHYLKGMALYGDEKDFPPGVDVIFNTNKTSDKNKQQVLKELKEPLTGANPFGATVKRQAYMLDEKGQPVVNERLTKLSKKLGNTKPVYENGAINIVNEEGDWGDWSKALSAQFLSKQPDKVISERLGSTLKKVDMEYDEIQKITNPVIKKNLLENYSNELESKQVHLKAAAPKGFQAHVILPVPKMKENEVYAPNYKDGDRVILVRYPHGGTFEIPELIVNNKGPGKGIIGPQSRDAIGIHPKVASKLSGADFDGDTAYVIPNNHGRFKATKSLAGLKNFDPNIYEDTPGTFKLMTDKSKGGHMGDISNLITDMTMRNVSPDELARAVRHSMVVIDAPKHKLNYQRSYEENGIKALKEKYQRHTDNIDYSKLERYDPVSRRTEKVIDPADLKRTGKEGYGAATVISRHSQKVTTGGTVLEVPNASGRGTKIIVRNRSKSYTTTMMKDASAYLSKDSSYAEHAYVDYINQLKKRKELIDKEIPTIVIPKRDPKMAIIYKDEVNSLKDKLNTSLSNAPKERQAQLLATKTVNDYIESKGGKDNIDSDELKKLRNQAITGARVKVGAKRTPVVITDDEWDAIQSNAISPNMLTQLTRHMNDDQLKALAMPRDTPILTPAKRSKALAMVNNGYTNAEIASMLGVSASTVSKIVSEG